MTNLRRTSLLAFAVVTLAAAGCGDTEEKNDYVDQINELQLAYVDDVTTEVAGAPATNAKESAAVAGTLAELTQTLADNIEAVTPPEEVTDLHAEMVTTLDDVAGQITDAQDTIANGNPQEAAQAAAELQAASTAAQTQLDGIITEINSELQN